MGGQLNLSQLDSQANEALKPERLGRYATDFVRSTSAGRKVVNLGEYLRAENLNEAFSPERMNKAVSDFAERTYRSAIDRILGKVSKYQSSDSEYRDKIRKYVARILEGDNLGAEVNEVTANWLRKLEYQDVNTGKRGKSPLGFNERSFGRSTVYIPRVAENVGIIVSQGIQDYIRVHELIETTDAKPKGETEHEKMDATILDVLKEFSATNTRARQAYRGAISVYETRGEEDPYFRGVAKFYPIREEIRSNVFSLNNKTEEGMLNLAA